MYLMREPAPIPAYLQPPSREVVEKLGLLIERIRLRQAIFMRHWRTLCTTSADAPGIHPERLLEETYVPRLRRAIACLARGDTAGFLTSGRALGADLADAGVPFAAMVTHASFLKDGCARTLADDPVAVGPALLVLERGSLCSDHHRPAARRLLRGGAIGRSAGARTRGSYPLASRSTCSTARVWGKVPRSAPRSVPWCPGCLPAAGGNCRGKARTPWHIGC